MNQIIEIVISPTGETRVETKGFSGGACRNGSKFIEESLGKAAEEQLTGEFFAKPTEQQSLRHATR